MIDSLIDFVARHPYFFGGAASVIAAIIVLIAVGMWHDPQRTSLTISLLLSALGHIVRFGAQLLRLRRPETRDAEIAARSKRPTPTNLGTISAFLSDVIPKKRPKKPE